MIQIDAYDHYYDLPLAIVISQEGQMPSGAIVN